MERISLKIGDGKFCYYPFPSHKTSLSFSVLCCHKIALKWWSCGDIDNDNDIQRVDCSEMKVSYEKIIQLFV